MERYHSWKMWNRTSLYLLHCRTSFLTIARRQWKPLHLFQFHQCSCFCQRYIQLLWWTWITLHMWRKKKGLDDFLQKKKSLLIFIFKMPISDKVVVAPGGEDLIFLQNKEFTDPVGGQKKISKKENWFGGQTTQLVITFLLLLTIRVWSASWWD